MKNVVFVLLLALTASVYGQRTAQNLIQVWGDAPQKLPDDLSTETVLFLKFDSVDVPAERPRGMDKHYYAKLTNHNDMVIKANRELYEYAVKYPFKYEIVSMSDIKSYRAYGAKYLFYMNGFDAFTTIGFSYTYTRQSPGNMMYIKYDTSGELGFVDLTADKSYRIDTIYANQVYQYKDMFAKLFYAIKKQFGIDVNK